MCRIKKKEKEKNESDKKEGNKRNNKLDAQKKYVE